MNGIILFDGDCNVCNKSVEFILKRDSHNFFKFASLQSEIGKRLLDRHRLPYELNSLVLIENDRSYLKSSAALRVCSHLDGAWKLFIIFSVVPKSIRDRVYNIISKNRYRWFGKQESCRLPSAEERKKFLD